MRRYIAAIIVFAMFVQIGQPALAQSHPESIQPTASASEQKELLEIVQPLLQNQKFLNILTKLGQMNEDDLTTALTSYESDPSNKKDEDNSMIMIVLRTLLYAYGAAAVVMLFPQIAKIFRNADVSKLQNEYNLFYKVQLGKYEEVSGEKYGFEIEVPAKEMLRHAVNSLTQDAEAKNAWINHVDLGYTGKNNKNETIVELRLNPPATNENEYLLRLDQVIKSFYGFGIDDPQFEALLLSEKSLPIQFHRSSDRYSVEKWNQNHPSKKIVDSDRNDYLKLVNLLFAIEISELPKTIQDQVIATQQVFKNRRGWTSNIIERGIFRVIKDGHYEFRNILQVPDKTLKYFDMMLDVDNMASMLPVIKERIDNFLDRHFDLLWEIQPKAIRTYYDYLETVNDINRLEKINKKIKSSNEEVVKKLFTVRGLSVGYKPDLLDPDRRHLKVQAELGVITGREMIDKMTLWNQIVVRLNSALKIQQRVSSSNEEKKNAENEVVETRLELRKVFQMFTFYPVFGPDEFQKLPVIDFDPNSRWQAGDPTINYETFYDRLHWRTKLIPPGQFERSISNEDRKDILAAGKITEAPKVARANQQPLASSDKYDKSFLDKVRRWNDLTNKYFVTSDEETSDQIWKDSLEIWGLKPGENPDFENNMQGKYLVLENTMQQVVNVTFDEFITEYPEIIDAAPDPANVEAMVERTTEKYARLEAKIREFVTNKKTQYSPGQITDYMEEISALDNPKKLSYVVFRDSFDMEKMREDGKADHLYQVITYLHKHEIKGTKEKTDLARAALNVLLQDLAPYVKDAKQTKAAFKSACDKGVFGSDLIENEMSAQDNGQRFSPYPKWMTDIFNSLGINPSEYRAAHRQAILDLKQDNAPLSGSSNGSRNNDYLDQFVFTGKAKQETANGIDEKSPVYSSQGEQGIDENNLAAKPLSYQQTREKINRIKWKMNLVLRERPYTIQQLNAYLNEIYADPVKQEAWEKRLLPSMNLKPERQITGADSPLYKVLQASLYTHFRTPQLQGQDLTDLVYAMREVIADKLPKGQIKNRKVYNEAIAYGASEPVKLFGWGDVLMHFDYIIGGEDYVRTGLENGYYGSDGDKYFVYPRSYRSSSHDVVEDKAKTTGNKNPDNAKSSSNDVPVRLNQNQRDAQIVRRFRSNNWEFLQNRVPSIEELGVVLDAAIQEGRSEFVEKWMSRIEILDKKSVKLPITSSILRILRHQNYGLSELQWNTIKQLNEYLIKNDLLIEATVIESVMKSAAQKNRWDVVSLWRSYAQQKNIALYSGIETMLQEIRNRHEEQTKQLHARNKAGLPSESTVKTIEWFKNQIRQTVQETPYTIAQLNEYLNEIYEIDVKKKAWEAWLATMSLTPERKINGTDSKIYDVLQESLFTHLNSPILEGRDLTNLIFAFKEVVAEENKNQIHDRKAYNKALAYAASEPVKVFGSRSVPLGAGFFEYINDWQYGGNGPGGRRNQSSTPSVSWSPHYDDDPQVWFDYISSSQDDYDIIRTIETYVVVWDRNGWNNSGHLPENYWDMAEKIINLKNVRDSLHSVQKGFIDNIVQKSLENKKTIVTESWLDYAAKKGIKVSHDFITADLLKQSSNSIEWGIWKNYFDFDLDAKVKVFIFGLDDSNHNQKIWKKNFLLESESFKTNVLNALVYRGRISKKDLDKWLRFAKNNNIAIDNSVIAELISYDPLNARLMTDIDPSESSFVKALESLSLDQAESVYELLKSKPIAFQQNVINKILEGISSARVSVFKHATHDRKFSDVEIERIINNEITVNKSVYDATNLAKQIQWHLISDLLMYAKVNGKKISIELVCRVLKMAIQEDDFRDYTKYAFDQYLDLQDKDYREKVVNFALIDIKDSGDKSLESKLEEYIFENKLTPGIALLRLSSDEIARRLDVSRGDIKLYLEYLQTQKPEFRSETIDKALTLIASYKHIELERLEKFMNFLIKNELPLSNQLIERLIDASKNIKFIPEYTIRYYVDADNLVNQWIEYYERTTPKDKLHPRWAELQAEIKRPIFFGARARFPAWLASLNKSDKLQSGIPFVMLPEASAEAPSLYDQWKNNISNYFAKFSTGTTQTQVKVSKTETFDSAPEIELQTIVDQLKALKTDPAGYQAALTQHQDRIRELSDVLMSTGIEGRKSAINILGRAAKEIELMPVVTTFHKESGKFFAALMLAHLYQSMTNKGIQAQEFADLIRAMPQEMLRFGTFSISAAGTNTIFDMTSMLSFKLSQQHGSQALAEMAYLNKSMSNAGGLLSVASRERFVRTQIGMLAATIINLFLYDHNQLSTQQIFGQAIKGQTGFALAQLMLERVAIGGGLAAADMLIFKRAVDMAKIGARTASLSTGIPGLVLMAATFVIADPITKSINHHLQNKDLSDAILTSNLQFQDWLDGTPVRKIALSDLWTKDVCESQKGQEQGYCYAQRMMQAYQMYLTQMTYEPVQEVNQLAIEKQKNLDAKYKVNNVWDTQKGDYSSLSVVAVSTDQNYFKAIDQLWEEYTSQAVAAYHEVHDGIDPDLKKIARSIQDEQNMPEVLGELNIEFGISRLGFHPAFNQRPDPGAAYTMDINDWSDRVIYDGKQISKMKLENSIHTPSGNIPTASSVADREMVRAMVLAQMQGMLVQQILDGSQIVQSRGQAFAMNQQGRKLHARWTDYRSGQHLEYGIWHDLYNFSKSKTQMSPMISNQEQYNQWNQHYKELQNMTSRYPTTFFDQVVTVVAPRDRKFNENEFLYDIAYFSKCQWNKQGNALIAYAKNERLYEQQDSYQNAKTKALKPQNPAGEPQYLWATDQEIDRYRDQQLNEVPLGLAQIFTQDEKVKMDGTPLLHYYNTIGISPSTLQGVAIQCIQ